MAGVQGVAGGGQELAREGKCHPEGIPIKVFGHLRQALAKCEGQVFIAHQLLNSVLSHAYCLQAGQGLQQVGPQQPPSTPSLGVVQKPA